MMAHASIMRITYNTLVGCELLQDFDPALVAARSARQMQDTSHAVDLYLKVIYISLLWLLSISVLECINILYIQLYT